MKTVLIAMALFISVPVFAQEGIESKKIFVRLYNLQGNKIVKGKILSISDDAIKIEKGKQPLSISISDIGNIKTKHSAGHNVLIGASAGAATGIILGVISADGDAGWGTAFATGGGLAFGAIGGAVGGISALIKKVENYPIGGDPEKWEAFKSAMNAEE